MKPETKKAMYWGLGILGGIGLIWGVVALIKKTAGSSSGGTVSGQSLSKGQALYSKSRRVLFQYVPSGAEKCYFPAFQPGEWLGIYLGEVSAEQVRSTFAQDGQFCVPDHIFTNMWVGTDEADRSGMFVKVSRPGGQTLFLGKSPDLYTK